MCSFSTLEHFLKKNGQWLFLYFDMNLPRDGTNQLPKAGFALMALKVIFQGWKGINLPFLSNIDTYCQFTQKPLFWHEASPGSWRRTVKRHIWLSHSNGHCQGQKGQVWLIFTHLTILISSIEVLPKCISSCSYSEVILVLFSNINGVDWLQRLFSRSERSNLDLCYLFRPISQKGCMLWPMFVWSTYTKSLWSFSWPCDFWPWITLKGQIKVTDLSRGCVS